MSTSPRIQGVLPTTELKAVDAEACGDQVRQCAAQHLAVIDYGIHHGGMGHTPPTRHARIELPAGVMRHDVNDMTVQVAGGTSLRDLNHHLAQHDQYLPLDGLTPDMTIAEAIAHHVNGPLRLTHGTCRDQLLGLTVIDGAGRIIPVGGRTVKNVAGYDLTRAAVGSLNMLGLIADATLKTVAIPKAVCTIDLVDIDLEQWNTRWTALLCDDAAPWYVDGVYRENCFTLHLAYAGTASACGKLESQLQQWLANQAMGHAPPVIHHTAWQADDAERAARRQWRCIEPAWVQVVVPPAYTGQIAQRLARLPHPPEVMDILPVHGVLHLGGAWSVSAAQENDPILLAIVQEAGGWRAWMRRPEHHASLARFCAEISGCRLDAASLPRDGSGSAFQSGATGVKRQVDRPGTVFHDASGRQPCAMPVTIRS